LRKRSRIIFVASARSCFVTPRLELHCEAKVNHFISRRALSLTDAGAVRIIARGQNPSSGHEDRYTLGENTTCNSCHGLQDARPYDGVLSLPLRP
jgi:hypothetical protein